MLFTSMRFDLSERSIPQKSAAHPAHRIVRYLHKFRVAVLSIPWFSLAEKISKNKKAPESLLPLSGAALCALCLGAHDRRFTRLQSDSGSQAKPLHLANARPFGRLKAPLGLPLLRCAAQTRISISVAMSSHNLFLR